MSPRTTRGTGRYLIRSKVLLELPKLWQVLLTSNDAGFVFMDASPYITNKFVAIRQIWSNAVKGSWKLSSLLSVAAVVISHRTEETF